MLPGRCGKWASGVQPLWYKLCQTYFAPWFTGSNSQSKNAKGSSEGSPRSDYL